MIPKELNHALNLADSGRSIWRSFVEKMKVKNNEFVILIPQSNHEFLYYSLLYLKPFCRTTGQKVHIITSEEIISKSIAYFNVDVATITIISEEDCQAIISFYSLYMFTDKLIILSPSQPKGRTGLKLVLNGLINIEEFISVGIYHNGQFVREPIPVYEGNDSELIRFFYVNRGE